MSMRMLIDARHPEETRVAVVKGNRIEEFDFEAAAKKQLKGNIYLARVTRVEPSLQAAFIEYGGNRHGFLAFSEIHPDYYQIPKEDREALLREEMALEREHLDELQAEEAEGNVHDVNGEDAEHHVEEHGGHEDSATEAMRRTRMALRRRYKIQEVIRRRQILLVQVVKEERGNKGAALTTYLSLAGRYSVLMPNSSHGGGISRKISNQADRRRLKSIISDLKLPPGMGCIVRTAGLKRTKAEIRRDFDYLTRLWDDIREATMQSIAPALIYEDSDLIKRAIRDIYSREIDAVYVEGEAGYKAAKNFMRLLMPSHAKKVQQYIDPVPLFQRFQVENQLSSMYQPIVQLKSGGYIVINPTEALVSIDINSGRSTKEHNIEETALKTNLEAADEIARQLRLRDMAGLVVIDFIDMEVSGNIRKVERQMKEALKNDRARIQVGRISSFGLMEMSRQRLRTGMLEASTHTCPMCDGAGIVRSIPSAALAALRGIEEEAIRGKASLFNLRAALDVATYILNRKRAELADIETRYGISIDVTPDRELIVPHFAIDSAGPAPARPVQSAAVLPPPVVEEEDLLEEEEIEEEEVVVEEAAEERGGRGRRDEPERAGDREDREDRGGRRRRRRRRRGRRGGEVEQPHGEAGIETAEEPAEPAEAVIEEGAESPVPAEAHHDEAAESEQRRRRRRGRRGGRRRGQEGAVDQPQVEEEGTTEAAEAEAEAIAEASPIVVAADTTVEEAVEAAPKPARRRRTSRKATAEAEVPVIEATVEAVVPETPAEERQAEPVKRTRTRKAATGTRTRRSKVAAEAVAAPAETATIAEEIATAPTAPEPAAAAAPAAANDPEPALEQAETTGTPKPTRKGWWQRTFGE